MPEGTENTPDAAAETSGDSGAENAQQQTAASEEVDWQKRFEAQQKVNRDLEAKLKKSAEGDGHARAKELEAKLAKLEGREAEWEAAQKAQAIKDEALAKANERIVSSELRLAAKGRVADDVLADIALFIKPSDFEVGEDGSVDTDAIARAVDDLIKNKPSLAAQGKRFQGGADGGARNGATTSLDDQIAEATKAGNHRLAISLKRQKAYADKT